MNKREMLVDVRTNRRADAEAIRALVDKAKAENRSLNAAESAEFDRLEANIRDFDDRIDELEIQLSHDAAAESMARAYAPNTSKGNTLIERNNAVMPGTSRVQVIRSEEIYRPDDNKSYFRDLYLARNKGDRDAADRLALNNRLQLESRAISTTNGAGGEFVPPLWLESEFIKLARPGRVTVDLTNVSPLPAGTDTINLPKVATGTTVNAQSAQNSAIANTDITTTSVSSPVQTIAGGQTVSLQLIEQSPLNIDQVILNDLAAAYGANFDNQVLNGSGTGGNLTGILTLTGTNAVDFTTPTGTPTQAQVVSALYSKVANAIQLITTQRFLPPDAIIMHPRRWAWLTATSDASNRPLVVPHANGAFNAVGVSDAVAAEGYVGSMLGLPVYVDSQIPLTYTKDAGTGEDAIIVARMADLFTYESHVRAEAFEQTYSQNMSVFVRLYAYVGFIGNRYPASISVITGSGLSAPIF